MRNDFQSSEKKTNAIDQENAKRVAEIQKDAELNNTALYQVKEGRIEKRGPLSTTFAGKYTQIVGATFCLVTGIICINEAFGLVRIGGRTPLTLIRDFISKD